MSPITGMNWLDYTLIFIIVLNFYNGLRRGFLRQVAGLAGFFIVLYVALVWSATARGYLQKYLRLEDIITAFTQNGEASRWLMEILANIISFLLIFFLLSFLLGLIIDKLSIFNKIPIIGPLNILLGGILGALKGILLVFLIAALISLLETPFWIKAIEASAVVALASHYIPLFFGLFFDFIVGKLGKLI